MKYDIAAKVIVDIGKEAILRRFLNIDPDSVQLIEELPEETVSLKRSDFPLHVVLKDGSEKIVLLEIQTIFDRDFVIRLIDYTARFMLKYHLDVIPFALSLTKSSLATGIYESDYIIFKYEVVRLWEEQSSKFLDEVSLYPFLPLMDGKESIIEEAEKRIYDNSELKIVEKADLLTAMAIFAGLKDKELTIKLINRRRDIMIQSIAYDIIREEGHREGHKEGLEEGLKEGLEKGLREGLYNAISMGLEIKFGTSGLALMEKIKKIESNDKLEIIKEVVKITNKLEEIEKLI
jgi:predicted transposase YdaD